MPALTPTNDKSPYNVTVSENDEYLIIKVKKDAKLKASSTGKSKLLASSEGWLNFDNLEGKSLAGKEIGIGLNISVRDKKKAKKRMDDDDE